VKLSIAYSGNPGSVSYYPTDLACSIGLLQKYEDVQTLFLGKQNVQQSKSGT